MSARVLDSDVAGSASFAIRLAVAAVACVVRAGPLAGSGTATGAGRGAALALVSGALLCARAVSSADTELARHQDEATLENALGVRVSHSGHFPPTFLRIAPNPLRDEPNMSSAKVAQRRRQTISGSRRAYAVTMMSYLKEEWCATEPVKQVIRKAGCLKKTVVNRFCYGQCNSFFIPRRRGDDIDRSAFKSCAFCRPKRTEVVRVTLHCPGRGVPRIRKKVEVIKSCNCMALALN